MSMPTVARETASERVVLLLRPKQKRSLERLARKEKVSAAELMRRSLALYAELDALARSGKLAQAEAAFDRTLLSIQSARDSIQATLKDIDDRHRDPVYIATQKRLDEIVRYAATQEHKQEPKKISNRRVAA